MTLTPHGRCGIGRKRRVRSAVLLTCAALLLAGAVACTDDPAPAASAPDQSIGSGASAAPGGCDKTPLWAGAHPGWTDSANPPAGIPYAASHEGNLVAVLFAQPLRAGTGIENPANKILWIAREPRNGAELKLVLRRTDGTGEPVESVEPADSSPGEIYPSIVDVPTPGCWSVTATWDVNTATLELAYE